MINGERLGGDDVRERYFLGADLARDLRALSLRGYRDIYRTYGPRSYRYAEMVFGNTVNVAKVCRVDASGEDSRDAHQQTHSNRRDHSSYAVCPVDEVRRFNPGAAATRAGTGHALPADACRGARRRRVVLASARECGIRRGTERFRATRGHARGWDDPAFAPVLRAFQRRFAETKTEEGSVMATVLAYVIDETYSSRRGAILVEFRNSTDVQRLFVRGLAERAAARVAAATPPGEQLLGTD